MEIATTYIEQNLLKFRIPLKLKIPNLSNFLFQVFEKRSMVALDKAYYLGRGFLGEIEEDTFPISQKEFAKFKDLLAITRELNEYFEKIYLPKLFKMKMKLLEIQKILEEIESHLVDASTLSETDYLTINKANKKELDRAINSNDYVEHSSEDFIRDIGQEELMTNID